VKLDLRSPLIVILGNWNTAILQPPWVSRFLLGYEEGEDVQIIEIVPADIRPVRRIFYIAGIGLCPSNQRVEIYSNDYNEDAFGKLENVAINLINVLKHTPMGGVGINFRFILDEPDEKLIDSLNTNETLNQHYKISSQSVTTTMLLENDVILNLTRIFESNSIKFDFNFHHPQISPDNYEELLAGVLNDALN
jgi:hypothetical protein